MSKDELLSALTSSKPIRKDETNSKETKQIWIFLNQE